jgi:hypothetical protein
LALVWYTSYSKTQLFMEDNQVLAHIKNLTAKEEELYGKENLTDNDVKKLHQVKADLDQCWDFLRQRRALRDAGGNPEKAEIRSVGTIESYKR